MKTKRKSTRKSNRKSTRKSNRKSNRKSKTINGGMHSSRRPANHRMSDEAKSLKTAEAAEQGIACAEMAVQSAEHAREQASLAVAAATGATELKKEVDRVLSKLRELEKAELEKAIESVISKLKDECADGLGKLRLTDGNYYGQVQDGKPHGLGICFHDNGQYYYQGNFVDGKMDGLGTMYNEEDKPFYEGEWKNDNPHGVGRKTHNDIIYEGQMKDGERHGRGTCKYGKQVYEGDMKNDHFNGFGVTTYADGNVHKGEYVHDSINGHGTYENGTRTTKYSGYFENDRPLNNRVHGFVRGKGTNPMPGGVYTGDMIFKRQRLIASGNGILAYTNGDMYTGKFRNNKKYGTGTLITLAPHTVQTGTWFDNKMHGTITYPNGTTVRGEFVDGVLLALLNVDSDLSEYSTDS